MMNRSKELVSLFRRYLIDKNTKKAKPIDIYFYEWSNVYSSPLHYFRVEPFSDFLKRSDIGLKPHHRAMIANLGTVFATCKKGTKDLIMRGDYYGLIAAMHEDVPSHVSGGTSNNNVVHRPTVYDDYYDESVYPYGDGTFFCT